MIFYTNIKDLLIKPIVFAQKFTLFILFTLFLLFTLFAETPPPRSGVGYRRQLAVLWSHLYNHRKRLLCELSCLAHLAHTHTHNRRVCFCAVLCSVVFYFALLCCARLCSALLCCASDVLCYHFVSDTKIRGKVSLSSSCNDQIPLPTRR